MQINTNTDLLLNQFNSTFEPLFEEEMSLSLKEDQSINKDVKLFTKVDNFRESKTNNKIALYDILASTDVATSTLPWQYQMIDEFKQILLTCSTEEQEAEASPFILALKQFLEKYGVEGFQLVNSYIISLASSLNVYLISEIMEVIGDVNAPISYNERRIFLENKLRSISPEIKYGAVIGLGNMHAKESINSLNEALKQETNATIASTMNSVLNLLKI